MTHARVLSFLMVCLMLVAGRCPAQTGTMKSIQEFGVLPGNTPEANRQNLQKAIDWASRSGQALWVEPVEDGYAVDGGIVLRRNVSLIGSHAPVGRGTRHPDRPQPVGSLFRITDTERPFITVESATQIRGIQFWYPEQTYNDSSRIIAYPPTIQVSHTQSVNAVNMTDLTFYGEYVAMDFNAVPSHPCEQMIFQHCYGYPLSGEFIRIDYCYDIPRILNCHVNPSNMREFGRSFSRDVIDAVMRRGSFCYAINHTDNAQLIDVFTFGTYGGVFLGPESYGQLTNFNLDCVTVGIHKTGANTKNRNWQIAQGSVIANAGADIKDIHPLIVEGEGHTSFVNVEAFSGGNGALTTIGSSYDFMLVRGDRKLTVTLFGCRMRNYTADAPFTIQNPKAVIQAVACVDKNEKLYNVTVNP